MKKNVCRTFSNDACRNHCHYYGNQERFPFRGYGISVYLCACWEFTMALLTSGLLFRPLDVVSILLFKPFPSHSRVLCTVGGTCSEIASSIASRSCEFKSNLGYKLGISKFQFREQCIMRVGIRTRRY